MGFKTFDHASMTRLTYVEEKLTNTHGLPTAEEQGKEPSEPGIHLQIDP